MAEHVLQSRHRGDARGGSPDVPAEALAEARLLEVLGAAVVVTTVDGMVTHWNWAAEKLFGWRVAEVRGRSVTDVIISAGTADAIRRNDGVTAALSVGATWRGEFAVRHRGGRAFPVRVVKSPVLDDDGQFVGIVSVWRDIGLQRLLEDDARLLLTLVNMSNDAITSVSRSGHITSWNSAAEQLYGYDAAEVIGRPFAVLSPGGDHEIDELIAGVDRDDAMDRSRTTRRVKSGAIVDVSLMVAPIRDRDGALIGLSLIEQDITEQLRLAVVAEEQLRRLAVAQDRVERTQLDATIAKEANAAKSEFVTQMSHELRTPLHAIMGFAQLLDRSARDEDDRESIAQIIGAGEHLLSLINATLDIARVEAGHADLTIESLPVGEVVAIAVDLLRVEASLHDVDVSTAIAGDGLRVAADRRRLLQVLLNVVGNAIKYNRRGGTVKLDAALVGSDVVRVTVADTGPGIAPADQARIFESFVRLQPDAAEGTGIGLALSQRLVTALSGRIAVDSVLGDGATFTIELPAAFT